MESLRERFAAELEEVKHRHCSEMEELQRGHAVAMQKLHDERGRVLEVKLNRMPLSHSYALEALTKQLAETLVKERVQLEREGHSFYEQGFVNGWRQMGFSNPNATNVSALSPWKAVVKGGLVDRVLPLKTCPPRPLDPVLTPGLSVHLPISGGVFESPRSAGLMVGTTPGSTPIRGLPAGVVVETSRSEDSGAGPSAGNNLPGGVGDEAVLPPGGV